MFQAKHNDGQIVEHTYHSHGNALLEEAAKCYTEIHNNQTSISRKMKKMGGKKGKGKQARKYIRLYQTPPTPKKELKKPPLLLPFHSAKPYSISHATME